MRQSKRGANALLKEVLKTPKKGKQQHKRLTLVPKPPSLPVYVFPIPDKPSDKLRIVCESLAKLKRGQQSTKELRVRKNTLARMIECYKEDKIRVSRGHRTSFPCKQPPFD